jgi:hypothetical protein
MGAPAPGQVGIVRRAHEGCGTKNPFGAAYLPWLAYVALAVRWEVVHSPSKMYRTWRP